MTTVASRHDKKVCKIKRIKWPYIINKNFQVFRTGEKPSRMRKAGPLWACSQGKHLFKKVTA